MPNKYLGNRCFFWLIAGVLLFVGGSRQLGAETRLFSFVTSKGLTIKVLQDNDMPFIHAELHIFLDGNTQNYASLAIAQLTVMNMFERELNSPPSNLLDLLQKQGNDYQVEQNPEFVKISMNFLPDRLSAFPKLLRDIFNYQSFHLKKFNLSKENFWFLYSKGRDWKKEMAFLLAYQQIVGNFYFSQGFSFQEFINKINLAQLRSFLLKTFRPENAVLVLKGKINPYYILGMIEKDFPQMSAAAAQAQERRNPHQCRPQDVHPERQFPRAADDLLVRHGPGRQRCQLPAVFYRQLQPCSAFPAVGSTSLKKISF